VFLPFQTNSREVEVVNIGNGRIDYLKFQTNSREVEVPFEPVKKPPPKFQTNSREVEVGIRGLSGFNSGFQTNSREVEVRSNFRMIDGKRRVSDELS